MPEYCYFCFGCGTRRNKILPVSRAKYRPRCCGQRMDRDFVAEHGRTAHAPGNWPMLSDAAGVHPAQIKEAYAASVKAGVPTGFTPDGRAIFSSAGHRKRYCEANGLYDRNGGFSDPQRRHG